MAPTLIIAAEHDEIIPRTSTESLYAYFRAGIASFKVVAGASHNTISESPDYMQRVPDLNLQLVRDTE